VFLLIGQQLPTVLRGLGNEPPGRTAAAIGVTLIAVLAVRPLWLFLTQIVPGWFGWRLGDSAPTLNGREVTALSWAGTRGVITLAAIFTVPTVLDNGRPFPDRDLLLLCAYMVVLITLVGQGLTFAPVLRRLGLRINENEAIAVRNDARLAALAAAAETLGDMQVEEGLPRPIADTLRSTLRVRGERLQARMTHLEESDTDDGWTPELELTARAQHRLIAAQRDELIRWRDSGRLPDESLRKMQRELDHEERTLPGG
jgi:NhaP-type Na+/H+ or K+/H+ antiporter